MNTNKINSLESKLYKLRERSACKLRERSKKKATQLIKENKVIENYIKVTDQSIKAIEIELKYIFK